MSLILSTLLLVGVLLYIFLPRRSIRALAAKSRAEYLRERRDVLYDNLRDLHFEFRAGKYPEEDYAAQRDDMEHETAKIVAEIRNVEHTGSPS